MPEKFYRICAIPNEGICEMHKFILIYLTDLLILLTFCANNKQLLFNILN